MEKKGPGHDGSSALLERLRNDILCCAIAPGTLLIESQLENQYRASRAAVRSALRELSSQGLTRSVPRMGHFVTTPTRQDAHEIFEIRELLEPWTARVAAHRITNDQIAGLRQLDYRIDREDPQSFSRSLASNRYFHLTIAQIAANQRVTRVLTEVHEAITRLLHMGLMSAVGAGELVDDHALLVDALSHHDADEAERLSRQEIQDAYRMFDRAITEILSSPRSPIVLPIGGPS